MAVDISAYEGLLPNKINEVIACLHVACLYAFVHTQQWKSCGVKRKL